MKNIFISIIVLLTIFITISPAIAGMKLQGGVVGARGIVMQENKAGQKMPVFVEYDLTGQVVKKIDVPSDEIYAAATMSAKTYIERSSMDKNWIPDPQVSIEAGIKSVLINVHTREVLHATKNNIGYWSAFYTKEGQNPEDHDYRSMGMYQRGDDLWGPMAGVKIEAPMGGTVVTNAKGFYTVTMNTYPSCLPYSEMRTLLATMRFTKFDPDRPLGYYYLARDAVVNVGSSVTMCSAMMGPSLGGQMAAIGISSIASSMAQSYRLVNFTVDIAMLTGKGLINNQIPVFGQNAPLDDTLNKNIKFSDITRYGYTKPEYKYKAPEPPLDYNNDGEPDSYIFSETTGKIEVWFKQDTTGNPDFVFQADHEPVDSDDFVHKGLLQNITTQDLQNTDIYVFRMSNDQLLAIRDGLKPSESNPYYGGGAFEGEASVYYKLMMRGPASFHRPGTREKDINQWLELMGADKELSGILFDNLRPGEKIKVILINRATGYIGSAITIFGEPGAGTINITPAIINMQPPNLKIQAKRKYRIETGATAGEEPEHIIGFEGSGLTSDQYIEITTEWTDADGSPLPQELEGYTGRLAKVVAQNTLNNTGYLANFEIKPGRHIQMVQLPEGTVSKAHYYVHISGEKIIDNPDFSSLGGDEAGELFAYRPKHYVPFMVPMFDKKETISSGTLIHKWLYRPEMQFSLFDLDKMDYQTEDVVTGDPKTIDLLDPDEEWGMTNESEYDFIYDLLKDKVESLDRFGAARDLVIFLAGQEIKVGYNEDNEIVFDNSNPLNLNSEDLLFARIYQNDDESNVLWEYKLFDLITPGAREINVTRSYPAIKFDPGVPIGDYIDYPAVIPFYVTPENGNACKVELTLHDEDGNEKTTLVSSTTLPGGKYACVLDYDTVSRAGILPGKNFSVVFTAELIGKDIKEQERVDCKLVLTSRGSMLGQVMAHDVLIQNGALNLSREDLTLNGRGQQLQFTRSYNKQIDDKSPLGAGWSHNYDKKVSGAVMGEDGKPLPEWAQVRKGSFFDPDEIPKLPWNFINANGTSFRKVGSTWYSERGRHGKLTINNEDLIFTSKDGTKYYYNTSAMFAGTSSNDKISRIVDSNNNELTFEYDFGVLKKVTDATGRSLEFNYTGNGFFDFSRRLSSVTSKETGITISFEYSQENFRSRLTKVTRDQKTETYEYEPEGGLLGFNDYNLVKTTDSLGNIYEYEYYAKDDLPPSYSSNLFIKPGTAVKTVTYPDTNFAEFTYNTTDNKRVVKDLKGALTTYTLNAWGNPLNIEEPLGKTSQMTWSMNEGKPDNVMTSKTDVNGTTAYEYDNNGNITKETDPLNNFVTTTFNEFSKPLTITDRNGVNQFWTYDDKGNLLTATDGDNHTIFFTYNATGEKITKTTPAGTTFFTWDENGNPNKTTEPEGSITDLDFDIRGRLVKQTNPNGFATTYEYNDLDYKISEMYPNMGNIIGGVQKLTFDYDAQGNLLNETDKNNLTLTYTYTPRNQVETITRGDNLGTKSFIYDYNGNLLSETDFKGIATTHAYNELNQRISTTNRLGITMEMDYDLAGNLKSKKDFNGNVTNYTYDKLNRIETIETLGTGGGIVTNTYYKESDPKTNLKTITDQENNLTSFEYNGRYLKTKRTNALNDVFQWEYDANGNLLKETDEELNFVSYEYDTQNRVMKMLQPEGVETQYTYDLNGNVKVTTTPTGHTIVNDYNSWNQLVKVKGPDGYTTESWYDGNGNIVKTIDHNNIAREQNRDKRGLVLKSIDGESNFATFTYDLNDNLETTTDPKGLLTTNTYDAGDRVLASTQTGVGINRTSSILEYDNMSNPLKQQDYNNNITETAYNAVYQPISVKDAKGKSIITDYYKTGQVKSVTDRRNNTTTSIIDALGRVTKITDAEEYTIDTEYDKVGNITKVTDKRNIITDNIYDALYRLTKVTKALTDITTNTYDLASNIKTAKDANNNTTEFNYNGRNLVTSTVLPDTNTVQNTYDGNGNVLTIINEEDKTTTFTYDRENRQLTASFAGETTTNTYDETGKLTSVKKPKNNMKQMTYDIASRLISVDDGVVITNYEYDNNDNLTFIKAPNGNVEYKYDELNQKTSHIQYKAGGNLVSTMEYDEEGNRSSVTDPGNQIISYVYDKINRQTDVTYPIKANNPDITETTAIVTEYDPNNNVTQITETKTGGLTDVTTNIYDDFDRLEQTTQRGLAINYGYDSNGNRTSVASSSGSTTYTFDTRNRLKTATTGPDTTTYTYTPDSKKDTVVYPNTTDIKYTYYDTDRIHEIINKNTDTQDLISSYTYEYDHNGNRTSQTEVQDQTTETTTYTYDTADRMTSYTLTGTDTIKTDYTFENYNRKTEIVTTNSTITKSRTYFYDETNWLTKVTDNSDTNNIFTIDYTFDRNGNTLTKKDSSLIDKDITYIYDSRDQLVQVTRGPPANLTVLGRYDYNASGLRVRHLLSERGDVNYYYDANSVLEERNASDNTLLAHYRYADRLLSLDTGSEVQYYHHDALGSTVNLTNADSSVKVSYWLDPYGQIRKQEGTSVNRQIFTGQEHDENTGLVYFGARYYDPDIARFITQDSYLGESGTPPSLHRYLYAYANPTVYIDLFGYDSQEYDSLDDVPNKTLYTIVPDFETGDDRYFNYNIDAWTDSDGIVDPSYFDISETDPQYMDRGLWGEHVREPVKKLLNQYDILVEPKGGDSPFAKNARKQTNQIVTEHRNKVEKIVDDPISVETGKIAASYYLLNKLKFSKGQKQKLKNFKRKIGNKLPDKNSIKKARKGIKKWYRKKFYGYPTKPKLRKAYEKEVHDLKGKIKLLKKGKTLNNDDAWEKIAREVSNDRRQLGIKYKDQTPSELREIIYEANIKRGYKDKLGPNVDDLYTKYGSWEVVAKKATDPGGWERVCDALKGNGIDPFEYFD